MGRKRKDGKPRAIILKFLRHTGKDAIIHNRRKLKGTGKVIRENLTQTRMGWINRLREHLDGRQIWSHDGTVVALIPSADKKYIKSVEGLNIVLSLLRE